MSLTIDLCGRTAVVTGASSGIGRGIAMVLAEAGANVVIAARRREPLKELSEQIGGPPGCLVVEVDLSSAGGPEYLAAQALTAFPTVGIVVNCAGGSNRLALGAAKLEWDSSMRINYEVARELSEHLLPGMIEERWGRIINITGSSEPPTLNAASPAKAAVHAWAKTLSRTVGGSNVTVNSISPGRIVSEQIDKRLHADASEREKFIAENIPLGYFGEPEDVGYLVAFLLSNMGRYITGEVIHVDGGMRRYAF